MNDNAASGMRSDESADGSAFSIGVRRLVRRHGIEQAAE